MKFARYTFLIAGVYGLLVMPVCYLMEQSIGREHPPAITHPEFFYGFIGIATAFQFVFLIVGTDPVRYRLLILPSILEKFSFGIAALSLWLTGRLEGGFLYGGMIDLFLGLMFFFSYLKLSGENSN
jgi:hypothetical protein